MKLKIASDKIGLFGYFGVLSLLGGSALQLPAAYVSGKAVPFIDSLFTAVSALCVTGLSSVDMAVYTRLGLCIVLLLIQLGGLGVLSFISIYLAMPSKKVSLVNRRIVRDYFVDDVEVNPRSILSNILKFTMLIQLSGAIALFPALMVSGVEHPLFDSIFLSVSAFNNAGFAPYSDNLVSLRHNPAILLIISSLIILGGIGFLVMQNVIQVVFKHKKRLTLHTKVVLITTAFLLISGTLVVFLTNRATCLSDLTLVNKWTNSFFESVTSRTAGFESVTQKSFSPVSTMYTLLLMFIGGSPGSIAGGIKTTTFFVVILYSLNEQSDRISTNFLHRKIAPETTSKALVIVSKSAFIIFLSVLALCISESDAIIAGTCFFIDIVFEVFSAFGTVGLTRGLTPTLTVAGKIIIILTMFIGRTGIFAMALHIRQDKVKAGLEYPEESVLVG